MSILALNGIFKSFAGVPALKGAHLAIRGGEIHALLGANGAGKSTLMKILSGAYPADQGTITLDGQPLAIASPADAKRHGIQCVYQEVDVALIPQLSAAENILIDRIVGNKGRRWVNWTALYREAEAILAGIGFRLPVRKPAGDLSLSQKQMVLIARAVAQKARFIIFDEPTAPLSVQEAEQLFRVMRRLKAEGVGCVFISHRLPEVFEICDRITVMRDGQTVSTRKASETDIAQVIHDMLGKPFREEYPKTEVPAGELLLEVRGLRRGRKVRGVDLEVRRGEIVGVAGLVGAGKSELARLIFGADRRDGGQVILKGQELQHRQPRDAIRAGIVLVPEERRKEGILVGEPVRSNLSLPVLKRFSPFGFIRSLAEHRFAQGLVDRLGVKASSLEMRVGLLSGGNQQKVAVGKWLETHAEVFLFDEPTKGVDVGAKSDIFRLIGRLAAQGKGILYFSCEISEILGIADRILVMCDGRIVKELKREEATQDQILFYASGGGERDERAVDGLRL